MIINSSLEKATWLPLARAVIYQWIAGAFQYPDATEWRRLSSSEMLQSLRQALAECGKVNPSQSLREIESRLAAIEREKFDDLVGAYYAAFGHAARGRCPLNEIEYGLIKADPLFQPHRLADLGAFYHAFGLEVSESAAERQDHISMECEFMVVLAAKEAHAIEHEATELLGFCRDAQKKFLKEHLGSWVPAFSRRLSAMVRGSILAEISEITRAFIEWDCTQMGVRFGSEDLLLRSVDAEEDLCQSCGIQSVLPGGMAKE
jgi:putative dimethyl sulfoxide reductase chaperone